MLEGKIVSFKRTIFWLFRDVKNCASDAVTPYGQLAGCTLNLSRNAPAGVEGYEYE
jgi:hypothetical protein